MKKKCPLKLLVVLVSVLLFSCQPDDNIIETGNAPREITSKNLSYDELIKMPGMSGVLSKFRTTHDTKSLSAKEIHSGKFNFTLDTDRVLYIESGDYHSFTFPITRDTINGYLENLFLHPHKDKYLAYIMRYNFSKEDLYNLDNGIDVKDILDKLTIIPINLDIDLGENIPVENPPTTYGNGDWHAGDLISYDGACWYITTIRPDPDNPGGKLLGLVRCRKCVCDTKPNQGGGGGYYVSPTIPYYQIVDLLGSGVGHGATGSNPNPFNPSGSGTNPVIGVVSPHFQTSDERNLVELKKMGTDPKMKATFTDLKTRVLGKSLPENERGYYYHDRLDPESVETPRGKFSINVRFGIGYYGLSHYHPDITRKGIPMFSLNDLFSLGMLKAKYGDHNADPSKFFISMTARYEDTSTTNHESKAMTFVIKISNWGQFNGAASSYYNISQIERDKMNAALLRAYQDRINSSLTSHIEFVSALQRYLYDNNITGIDIYVSEDSSMTRWGKYIFNSNSRQSQLIQLQ